MDGPSLPPAVDEHLADHEAFEPDPAGYRLNTTALETTLTASALEDDRFGFRMVVVVPTLSASVADQSVAEPVEESWFETFERRVRDAYHVTRVEDHDPPQVSREGDAVWVEFTYESDRTRLAVADAKALGEFVEGTFAEGLIPGYEYHGPAGELRSRALDRGSNPG